MAPIIIPALNLIPMPYSQSRTPARSGAQGLWAPAYARPLQPVPAGLSMGPPLAWMGCCLLTKRPPSAGAAKDRVRLKVCLCPSYLFPVPTDCPQYSRAQPGIRRGPVRGMASRGGPGCEWWAS